MMVYIITKFRDASFFLEQSLRKRAVSFSLPKIKVLKFNPEQV